MEIYNHGAEVSQVAKNKPTDGSNHGQAVSEVAKGKSATQAAKDMTNATLMTAMEEVSLSAGQESLALLYRAAVEAIDEHLAPYLGENSTQKGLDQGIDYSPEATADRIVSFGTQFFGMYQQQNSNLSFDEQLDGFMTVIGDAIEQGIGEAKDILEGLQVFNGDIKTNANKTHELVLEGLQEFRDSFYKDEASEVAEE